MPAARPRTSAMRSASHPSIADIWAGTGETRSTAAKVLTRAVRVAPSWSAAWLRTEARRCRPSPSIPTNCWDRSMMFQSIARWELGQEAGDNFVAIALERRRQGDEQAPVALLAGADHGEFVPQVPPGEPAPQPGFAPPVDQPGRPFWLDDRQRRPVTGQLPEGPGRSREPEDQLAGRVEQRPQPSLGLAPADVAGELGQGGQVDLFGMNRVGAWVGLRAADHGRGQVERHQRH